MINTTILQRHWHGSINDKTGEGATSQALETTVEIRGKERHQLDLTRDK